MEILFGYCNARMCYVLLKHKPTQPENGPVFNDHRMREAVVYRSLVSFA